MATVEYSKGLEGVIAAESSICRIDGQNGELYYRGYPISELARKVSFEEVMYLLMYGDLPTRAEYEKFHLRVRTQRDIQPSILEMIQNFPRDSHPMELLQSSIAYLSAYIDHKIVHSPTCHCTSTLHQVTQLATVVAAFHRIREGLEYVAPRKDLSFGANFLYMLRGEEPTGLEGEIMDACFTLHAEHHFNASTFTARVVASTNSTCYSSISAAIGALYGSLHGGANEKVMNMVEEIGTPENAEPWVNQALANKQKIMGMGHRVYKAKDPRSVIMEEFLETLSKEKGDDTSLRILKTVERVAGEHMKEKGKDVYPNVDFFSGAVYKLLGIPKVLYTPIFAASRVAGWLAHILEQRQDNRLYRPTAIYTGPDGKTVTPLEQR
jgi:citrate synthase